MNRIGFIGGSDARRILEGDWYDLWMEKTGRSQPEDLSMSLPVAMGIHTEDFNISWFHANQLNHQHRIQQQVRISKNNSTVHDVPCKGTVDGWIDDLQAIIECKHTYDRNTMENCIKTYMPQMQFYMHISDLKGCYLSVFFGNRRWECVHVSYDQDYCRRMFVHIAEFWNLVTQDKEPATGKQGTVLSTDQILVDNMTRRDASGDNHFISRCHDYIEQEANAKLFESAKADLKAMVGNTEREVYCDLLTIKRDKRGSLRITVKENNND
jgi:hypothetical protein